MDIAGTYTDSIAAGGQVARCAPTVQAVEAMATEGPSSDLDTCKGGQIGTPDQSEDSSTSSSDTPAATSETNNVAVREVRPPQPNLSNMLNPNNIYYDHRLACSYKRMSKVERDVLWALDAAVRQATPAAVSTGGNSTSSGYTYVVPDTATAAHGMTVPSQALPSAAITNAFQAGSMQFMAVPQQQQQQQQQLATTMLLDAQPGVRQVLTVPGLSQHRLVPSSTFPGDRTVQACRDQPGMLMDTAQKATYVAGPDGTLYAAPTGQVDGMFGGSVSASFYDAGCQQWAAPLAQGTAGIACHQAAAGSNNANMLPGMGAEAFAGTAVDDLTLSLDGLTCGDTQGPTSQHLAADSLHTWAVVTQQLTALLPPDALPSSVTDLVAQLINQRPQQQLLRQPTAAQVIGHGTLPEVEAAQQLGCHASSLHALSQLGAVQLGAGASPQLASEASTPAQQPSAVTPALVRQQGPSPQLQPHGSTHAVQMMSSSPAIVEDANAMLVNNSAHLISGASFLSDMGQVEDMQRAARASDTSGSLPQLRQTMPPPKSSSWLMLNARMQQLEGAPGAQQNEEEEQQQQQLVAAGKLLADKQPQPTHVQNQTQDMHFNPDGLHVDSHVTPTEPPQSTPLAALQQQQILGKLQQLQALSRAGKPPSTTMPTSMAAPTQHGPCYPDDQVAMMLSEAFAQDTTQALPCRTSVQGPLALDEVLLRNQMHSLGLAGPNAGGPVINLSSSQLQAKPSGSIGPSGPRVLMTHSSMPNSQHQLLLQPQLQQSAGVMREHVQMPQAPPSGQLFLQLPTQQQQPNVQWVQVPGGFVPVLQGSQGNALQRNIVMPPQSTSVLPHQQQQQLLLQPQQPRTQITTPQADNGSWVLASISEPLWYQ